MDAYGNTGNFMLHLARLCHNVEELRIISFFLSCHSFTWRLPISKGIWLEQFLRMPDPDAADFPEIWTYLLRQQELRKLGVLIYCKKLVDRRLAVLNSVNDPRYRRSRTVK